RWERPLRGPRGEQREAGSARDEDLRGRIARWTLSEAELLGVTGRGALAAPGRALIGAPEAPRPAAEAQESEPEGPGD
ncbi:DNA-binding protein, partial [Streptomyces coelicoflavus]|nr:DNA-binding protein [Streptomyces coelicoflavus]